MLVAVIVAVLANVERPSVIVVVEVVTVVEDVMVDVVVVSSAWLCRTAQTYIHTSTTSARGRANVVIGLGVVCALPSCEECG